MAGSRKQHIFVIDDDPGVCEAIRRTLEQEDWKVTTFADASSCLEDSHFQDCDLVISDVKMPGMDGIELLIELKRRASWLPVLIITAFGDVPMAARAFKEGTVDFIEKPMERDALVSAVRAALRKLGGRDSLLGKSLTRAEMRVLHLILDGKSNKEAARVLARSVRTVEVHRSHIMKKLGVDNLVDLVKTAYATGLAEPPS